MAAESSSSSNNQRWWEMSNAEVLRAVDSRITGLSSAEAKQRQAKFGPNEIPSPPSASLFKLILDQFQDLMVLILLGAAVVSFVLALFEEGEDRLTAFLEPAVILVILIANATVGVLQESNAEAAIQKLKKREAAKAHVIRDGHNIQVDAVDLVPGDIVIITVGDRVPADVRVLEPPGVSLTSDESPLTGESEPVVKHGEVITGVPDAVAQDKRNILFSSTLVTQGTCTGVVVLTGGGTEIGKIGLALQEDDDEEAKTPLQQKLDEFGETLSKVIGVICAVVWLINIGHFTDPAHGGVVKGAIYYFKIAVALAVAAIPEGLPAVVTTCLALGTMKMAKKNAIVRRLPSVETLGCTTVICSDKTGTLTTNMMVVRKVLTVDTVRPGAPTFREFSVDGNSFSPIGAVIDSETKAALEFPAVQQPSLAELAKIATLCNESTLGFEYDEKKNLSYTKTGASTEAALKVFAEKVGIPHEGKAREVFSSEDPRTRCQSASAHWDSHYKRAHVLEFDRIRKSMSVVSVDGDGRAILFVKGAPEGAMGILERCKAIRGASGETASLTPAVRKQLEAYLTSYADEGLRVLALAYNDRIDIKSDFSNKNRDRYIDFESGLTFVGFACMLDPPRREVLDSIAKCKSAHIRVIVITGDNEKTATAICRSIGVFDEKEDVTGKVYTGPQWKVMSDAEKDAAVHRASLFSRVEPKHKQELVQLLQSHGEVVAMTGDGVNDAPALDKADIGVAMGSGTDVAREASDMVLQDDNFATIVMAVEEGRAIYANTKQFIRYLISSNIGEVACIFLTAAIGMPEALIPVQLLWVNLVTDGLPATALGFNPADKDVMTKQPRGRTEKIINKWTFFRYVVIGVYVGIATVGGFIWWYLYSERGPKVSWTELTNFHGCDDAFAAGKFEGEHALWKEFAAEGGRCEIFHHDTASTVSLSILVTIEMFNALNALSENQSLLVVGLSNKWVVLACLLSFALHMMLLYVPFFNSVFHVTDLNAEEWLWVLYFSAPVFLIDEILKFISRRLPEPPLVKVAGERMEKKKPKKKVDAAKKHD